MGATLSPLKFSLNMLSLRPTFLIKAPTEESDNSNNFCCGLCFTNFVLAYTLLSYSSECALIRNPKPQKGNKFGLNFNISMAMASRDANRWY